MAWGLVKNSKYASHFQPPLRDVLEENLICLGRYLVCFRIQLGGIVAEDDDVDWDHW